MTKVLQHGGRVCIEVPGEATDADLELVHDPAYIAMVRLAGSRGCLTGDRAIGPAGYGPLTLMTGSGAWWAEPAREICNGREDAGRWPHTTRSGSTRGEGRVSLASN